MSYTTTATNTYSGNNTVIVTTISNMLSGLPIVFTGNVFGNVTANATYYIGNITGSNQITLSSLPGGAVYALANGSGNMTATFSTGGQQIIDVVPPGDPLDVAFEKTNVNFDQIFAAGPVGSNIQIANNTIRTTNTNGNLILAPNGIGNVVSNVNIVPNTANLRNLGSPTQRWATIYTQYIDYTAGNISFSNFSVSGNISAGGYISAAGNVTGNYILGNGSLLTGVAVSTGNITFSNTTISTSIANSTITLRGNGTGNVNLGSSVSVTGNITANYYYGNGSQLTGLPFSIITNQTINGTGSANTFALAQSATSDSVFVTINGISQTPETDYTVLGNAITFTTTPIVGDVAQIRFLAGNVLNVNYSNANVAAFLPTYSGLISNLNIQSQSVIGTLANTSVVLQANGTGQIVIQNTSNSYVLINSTGSNVQNGIRIATTGTNLGSLGGGIYDGSYILGNGTPTQINNRFVTLLGSGSENGTSVLIPAPVKITMDAAANWSNGNTPTHISFWTTNSGSNVAYETVRMESSGNLDVYTGSINAANGNISASYFIGNGSLLTGITGSGGTGNTGNITFNNTTITSNVANANVTVQGNGTGNVNLGSSVSVSGNITANYLYGNGYYLTGLLTTITNQTLTGNNVETNFTLDQTATANSVLVTVNGISQTPDIDYTVSGNVITFTTAPYTGDTMQVRFLANNFSSGGGNGDTGNITFNNTTISSNIANANVILRGNGTGAIVIQNTSNSSLIVNSTASNVTNKIAIQTVGTTSGPGDGGLFESSYILGNGTPTQINNRLLTIVGSGSQDGTTILTPAPVKITMSASANWSSGNTPTQIGFWTTPSGTNVAVQAATIESTGNLVINNGNINAAGGTITAGSVSASGNVVASNFSTFGNVSVAGNVYANNFVGNIAAAPGNTSIQINVDGVLGAAANFSYDYGANVLYAPSAAFSGNLTNGTTGLFVGLPAYTFLGSNIVTQITSNVASYAQVNQQNINSGNAASADYVITADNGSDSTFYIDIGMASSNHADPDFFGDTTTFNDAYMYVVATDQAGPAQNVGNLIIGSTNGNIKLFVGNTAQANVIQTISSTGVSVAGNVTANFFVGNGSALTGIVASANTGNVTFANINIIGTGNLHLQPDPANASSYLDIYLTAGPDIHIAGNGETVILGTDEFANVTVNVDGNVSIQANAATPYTWTFGTDGRLVNLDGLTLTAGGQFNICTILTGGSGYNTGSALKATTGGSGSGMTVGIGYGLSNQLTNVGVVDPGTGYVDGDVITVSEGTGGTFVITQYNDQANQANNNTIESNWMFGVDGTLTLPNSSTLKDTAGDAVAFGQGAGETSQGNAAVAVGTGAGSSNQGINAVAIGATAGATSQGANSIAIGAASGAQGEATIAIGLSSGFSNQGNYAVAVGHTAGANAQGLLAVAVGNSAGFTNQGQYAVAVGPGAGTTTQGAFSVAVGYSAGYDTQANSAIAIGGFAGATSQDQNAVAIGVQAGYTSQGLQAVAIGTLAGANIQGNNSVAIGWNAGYELQGSQAVAIGLYAGNNEQGQSAVAIGTNAGTTTQGQFSIAVGQGAGNTTQGEQAVSIGLQAGFTTQGNYAVAIGKFSANTNQGTYAVAVGPNAGMDNQLANAVAIGSSAGSNAQGTNSVAVGAGAAYNTQGANAVAVGNSAGYLLQGIDTVAIGDNAGFAFQGTYGVAIGAFAGNSSQGINSVAVGVSAGLSSQGAGAVAIGGVTGAVSQGGNATAVGPYAGFTGQGINAVAMGFYTGYANQGASAVAIGYLSGNSSQGNATVAVGVEAGKTSQGNGAVAVGNVAGSVSQGLNAVAVGREAGNTSQGVNSVAVGFGAGFSSQGTGAVAVGALAGSSSQANNSIIINATGSALNQTTANTFTVAPVRNDVANIGEVLFYNATSKEITYGNVISVAGNITGGNLSGTNITGTLTTAAQANITTVGTLGNLAVSGQANVTQQVNTARVSASGNITGGNLAISGNSATITSANYSIGYLNIPQVSFAANATIALTDAGKHYYSTSASNLLLTIANNTSVSWTIGTAITIVNRGTANITIAQGTGVSLYLAGNSTSGNRTMTTYGMSTLMNVAANVWMINGTGVV